MKLEHDYGHTCYFSGGIEKLLMMDTSWDMVKLCKDAEQQLPNDNIETSYIIGDEEYLPVKEKYVQLWCCP